MTVTKLTPAKVAVANGRDVSTKDAKTMVVITKQLEYAKNTWPEWYI